MLQKLDPSMQETFFFVGCMVDGYDFAHRPIILLLTFFGRKLARFDFRPTDAAVLKIPFRKLHGFEIIYMGSKSNYTQYQWKN